MQIWLHVAVNIRTYDFWTVVTQSGVVTQQLCRFAVFRFAECFELYTCNSQRI